MTRTHWTIAVFLLIGAGAVGVSRLSSSEEDATGPVLVATASSTETATPPEPAVEPDPAAAQTDAELSPAAPTIDAFSRDADGLVVIAGQAGGGALVEVTLGDEVLGDAVADANGAFVLFASVPQSQVAQALYLRSETDGVMVTSAAPILIPPNEVASLAAAGGTSGEEVLADAPEIVSAEELEATEPLTTQETGDEVAEVGIPEDAPMDVEDADVALQPIDELAEGDAVALGEAVARPAIEDEAGSELTPETEAEEGEIVAAVDEGAAQPTDDADVAEAPIVTSELEPVEEVSAPLSDETVADVSTEGAEDEVGGDVLAASNGIEAETVVADVDVAEGVDAPTVEQTAEDLAEVGVPATVAEADLSEVAQSETADEAVAAEDAPLVVADAALSEAPEVELSGDEVALVSIDVPTTPGSAADTSPVVSTDTAQPEADSAALAALPEITDLSVQPLGVDTAPSTPPEVEAVGASELFDTADVADATVTAPPVVSDDGVARTELVLPAQPAEETAPVETAAPEVAADVPDLTEPEVDVAPAQLPVLLADPSGVRVLQPALAAGADEDVLRSVALDTISYDAAGDVQIGGRATGGGQVRIYLNNALFKEVGVTGDGTWAASLTEVPTGVYTMRVDQVAAGGEVISRIETPFQREERAVIAAVLAEDLADGQEIAVRTVQAGNTLWGISQERYGDGMLFVRVFEANRDLIRDPNLIYPGQILRIPEGESVQD